MNDGWATEPGPRPGVGGTVGGRSGMGLVPGGGSAQRVDGGTEADSREPARLRGSMADHAR
jgi:hypothetical protein